MAMTSNAACWPSLSAAALQQQSARWSWPGGKAIEVVRIRITAAGRRAIGAE
jgi:hypothetical protein